MEDRVNYVCSDNFESIPHDILFDCIVANPPNYCNNNPKHELGKAYLNDLRPNDRGWKIHEDFYANAANHLQDKSKLFISEVEPFMTEVMIPQSHKQPYDMRLKLPIIEFKHMIKKGGLTLESVEPFYQFKNGLQLYMIVSSYQNS